MSNTGPASQEPVGNEKAIPLSAKRQSSKIVERSPPIEAGLESGFEVQAIAWSIISAERLAVINDQIVQEGDAVDGALVSQIGLEDVFLKSGGKILKLNVKFK